MPQNKELSVNDNAHHEEAFTPENSDEPTTDRQDNRVRYEIRRQDPGALIAARTEVTGNVRKGNIGYACI
jgi:hypothetical protein